MDITTLKTNRTGKKPLPVKSRAVRRACPRENPSAQTGGDPDTGGLRIPVSLYGHPAWVSWKESQGWREVGKIDGHPVLYRNGGSNAPMAYIAGNPCGEFMDDDYGGRLEELSLRAMPFLPADCAFIRWDLMASPFRDSRGELQDRRFLELRMNASTERRSFRKAPTETFGLDTIVVSLRDGWPAVFSRMDYRVRYSERLAERRGTVVSKAGEAGIGDFYALFRKTARLRGLRVAEESCYRALFAAARQNGLGLDLYLATASEKPVASAIIARTEGEAWYLFAASDPEWRQAAGPTAILNRAMRDCADGGIDVIDLLGVAPEGMGSHPMSGLSRFKSGFGGSGKSRAGAWDFILDHGAYADHANAESLAIR